MLLQVHGVNLVLLIAVGRVAMVCASLYPAQPPSSETIIMVESTKRHTLIDKRHTSWSKCKFNCPPFHADRGNWARSGDTGATIPLRKSSRPAPRHDLRSGADHVLSCEIPRRGSWVVLRLRKSVGDAACDSERRCKILEAFMRGE